MRPKLVGEEFVVGFSLQTEWAALIGMAFFLGKVGAGLYLVSLFLGFPVAALIGLAIGVIGKGIFHLIYLGQPLRFWRIIMKPRSSWIARGLWAMGVWAVTGFLYLCVSVGWLGGDPASGGWQVIMVLSVISGFIVAIYDGYVINASPSIPLWNTPLMPVLCLFYSLLGGVTLTSLFGWMMRADWLPLHTLEVMEISLIALNAAMLVIYFSSMFNSTAAARQAVQLLLSGKFSAAFYILVVVIGILLSLLLAIYAWLTGQLGVVMVITVADLVGHFFIFYLILRSGTYAPVVAPETLL